MSFEINIVLLRETRTMDTDDNVSAIYKRILVLGIIDSLLYITSAKTEFTFQGTR